MKIQLPDTFLIAGKDGLSSILISLRNYAELFHDHTEGTKIATAEIPSSLTTVKIGAHQILSRSLALSRLTDSDPGPDTIIASNSDDPDLVLSPNFSFASILMLTLTLQCQASGRWFVRFKVDGGTRDPTSKISADQSGSSQMAIIHSDIIPLSSGAHTINVQYRKDSGADLNLENERRLDAIVFAQ